MRDKSKLMSALLMVALVLLVPLVIMEPAHAVDPTGFEGTITDYTTDEPIEGANLLVLDGKRGKEVKTDEKGYYRIELERGGEYSLIASMEDYYDEYKEEIIIVGEMRTVDFVLISYKTFVSGRITDDKTGEGIHDAYIEFYSKQITTHGFSDEDGYYEIGIEPGSYNITIHANNYDVYREEDFQIVEGQDNEKDISLEKFEQGIFGYVYHENGDPVEEAQLVINAMGGGSTRYCYSDENGYYETYLRKGKFKISVNKPGSASTRGSVDIEHQEMLEKDWTLYESSPKSFIMRLIELIWKMIGMEL